MQLAAAARMPQVRALAEDRLRGLRATLAARDDGVAARAHGTRLATEVQRFLDRPAPPAEAPRPLGPPPGSPIGGR